MSEASDKESKTEEATEKRRRDAIEKGNVPFSKEVATFASLCVMLVVACFFIADQVVHLRGVLERFLENPGAWPLENGADALLLFQSTAGDLALFIMPVAILSLIAGLASSFLQTAPQLVISRIQPQLSRISLAGGWKRLFGAHGLVEFLKSLFKLGALSVVALVTIRSLQYDVFNAMLVDSSALPALVKSIFIHLGGALLIAAVLLAAGDVMWSRIYWQRELRMTRQEVKDELKEVDGDPVVKARLRSLARDRARRRMIAAVPRATLVITNPTHFAVALRYVRKEGGAPIVVAKGQDLLAIKIREIANKHEIPIVEDQPLARALYKKVDIDQAIPHEFYKAVAQIIHYLLAREPHRTRAMR